MLTLTSALENTIRLYSSRPAVRDDGLELSWLEYGNEIARAAGMLRKLGLARGDRLAIISRNSAQQGELIYGCYWSGIVPAPINYRLSPLEIAEILDDAACSAVAIDPDYQHLLQDPLLSSWNSKALVLGDSPVDAALPSYAALKAGASALPAETMAESDDALLLYTGGTTARGKGVRLSHKNIMSNALQLLQTMLPREDDVFLHSTPMFHAAELKSTIFTMRGACHTYLPEFTPVKLLSDIEKYGITVASLVPTTLARLLDEPSLHSFDVSSLRLITYGTSPIQPTLVRRTMQTLPAVDLVQCYGLTECSPYLSMLDSTDHRRALNGEEHLLSSAGRPLPGLDIRVLDDKGNEVRNGDPGEVVVRGPQVALGYRNRPKEQSATFREDGFRTGDVGRFDQDGFLYLLDRKRDLVISGGENIYTREVEDVIGGHPGVREVAVFGVPDNEFGEALFAAIVAFDDEPPTKDKLISYCRGFLGGYKIPRQMAFVEELPKSAVGKVLKQILRKRFGRQDDMQSTEESAK
jgi:long-chain acyl-CoA synthetase